jgi:hypothetical protein
MATLALEVGVVVVDRVPTHFTLSIDKDVPRFAAVNFSSTTQVNLETLAQENATTVAPVTVESQLGCAMVETVTVFQSVEAS